MRDVLHRRSDEAIPAEHNCSDFGEPCQLNPEDGTRTDPAFQGKIQDDKLVDGELFQVDVSDYAYCE